MSLTAAGREFNDLKEALEGLALDVLAQLSALERAYAASDRAALAAIVANDKDIDAKEQRVDVLCRRFIQLRSPIGPDFRFVMGVFDIARGLERIGDCIEYVARHALKQVLAGASGDGPRLIREMIAACLELLEATHASWIALDTSMARSVLPLDDGVDALQKRAHRAIVAEVRGGGLDVELGLETVLIVNKLESLADVTCHMAEAVVFMIDATDIRHGRAQDAGLKAL